MRGVKSPQIHESKFLDTIVHNGYVKDFRTAVDIGAHAGSWTVKMAQAFQNVIAVEPEVIAYDFMCENVADFDNVDTYLAAAVDCPAIDHIALVAPGKKTRKSIKLKRALTSRQVMPDGKDFVGEVQAYVPAITVDKLCLGQPHIDLLKIDVEGYEAQVIRGARKTIERCKPCLVVEINELCRRMGETPQSMKRLIEGLGYKQVHHDNVDYVFVARS